jgi:hypothetical protein
LGCGLGDGDGVSLDPFAAGAPPVPGLPPEPVPRPDPEPLPEPPLPPDPPFELLLPLADGRRAQVEVPDPLENTLKGSVSVSPASVNGAPDTDLPMAGSCRVIRLPAIEHGPLSVSQGARHIRLNLTGHAETENPHKSLEIGRN